MRSKDKNLLEKIKNYIDEQCDYNDHSPSVSEISEEFGVSRATAFRYMSELAKIGKLIKEGDSYQSVHRSVSENTIAVQKVGRVPCGPLSEEFQSEEGYLRLPTSMVGNAKKCYLLTASGNSMIEAGIADGDLVLIKQTQQAFYDDIIVALVDNEVTLKRFRPDPTNNKIILHPENSAMKDIIVKNVYIQGVAIRVIKNLEVER